MTSFTCLACNVAFEDVDLGRLHYKTDWHRYNLKRKVANLCPVTLEVFQERQRVQENRESVDASSQERCFCKPCNKCFSSTKAYDNHLQSKKHKDVVSGKGKQSKKNKRQGGPTTPAVVSKATTQPIEEDMDDDSDVESWDSYDEDVLGLEECLFCSAVSATLENNIQHMTASHGFFLPDAEYISDLEGLVTYLGEKVGAGKVCLWCNEKGKRFHNTKDVQRHMVDKGHCKLLHEGDTVFEYADFYDYTSSYPDGDKGSKSHDEVVNPMELESDGFTLTLPSGSTIGHRSLLKYYQQNMTPYLREHNKRLVPKMLAHYKALGWTGTSGPQMEQRVKDLQYMQRMKQSYKMQLGCRANNLRHRFRDPNGV